MKPTICIEGATFETVRATVPLARSAYPGHSGNVECAAAAAGSVIQKWNPVATSDSQIEISGTLLWLLSFVPANESDRRPGAPAGSNETNY